MKRTIQLALPFYLICFLVPLVVSEKIKFAYIYDGPVGDAGYTFSHDLARLELEKRNSQDLRTTFYASVDYGQQSIDLIDDLVSTNFSIIAFSSNGFLASIEVAAKKHPSVLFIICDEAEPTQDNIAIVQPAIYESEYLAGIVAAIASKTDNVAIISNVLDTWSGKNINAFVIGARKIKPNINIYVDFINVWYDENLEASVTERLIQRHNADVITHHTDSFIPMITAKNSGKYGIGWAIDVRPFVGPRALTSVLLNFSIGLQYQFNLFTEKQHMNTSVNRIHWGVREGIVQLSPFSPLFNKTSSSYSIYLQEMEHLRNGNARIFCGEYAQQLNVNGTKLENGCLSYHQIERINTLLPFIMDVSLETDNITVPESSLEQSSAMNLLYSIVLIFSAMCNVL